MSKQVMLSEEAYRALSAAKGRDESFSDVIVRAFGVAEANVRDFERWMKANLPDPELADAIERAQRGARWRYLKPQRRSPRA